MLLSILIFAASAFAGVDPFQTALSMESFLARVPGGASLGCLVNDYLDVVGTDNNPGANFGISRYIQRAYEKAGPGFTADAHEFYDEVNAQLTKPHYPLPPVSFAHRSESPMIYERAGDNAHTDLPPGWLWNLALKHSHGNPNAAMRMIGACGHDDIMQGNFPFTRSAEESAKIIADRRAWVAGMVAKIQARKGSGGECHPEYVHGIPEAEEDFRQGQSSYDSWFNCGEAKKPELIAALQKYSDELKPETVSGGSLSCPIGFGSQDGEAGFFLPESLGKGVDIPDSLKQKLAQTQAPFTCQVARKISPGTDPLHCLPAKHYHVYGAAFVACEMISRGHSPFLVKQLQRALAWYYRAYALETLANTCKVSINKDGLTADTAGSWLETLAELRHLDGRVSCPLSVIVDSDPADFAASGDSTHCDQPTRDALYLFRQWTILGKAGKPLAGFLPNLGEVPVVPADRPAAWSAPRFELALAKAKQMASDFEWTMAEHSVGAEFAAKHCRPEPGAKAFRACPAKGESGAGAFRRAKPC